MLDLKEKYSHRQKNTQMESLAPRQTHHFRHCTKFKEKVKKVKVIEHSILENL